MTLLLTSTGIQEGFKDIFLSLLQKPLHSLSVAYIITAAFGEEGEKPWINIAKRQLQKLGITTIEDIDLRGKKEDEVYKILSKKDIILVNGGNTFYLLKYARESGFDRIVAKLLNQGKLYIGVSAGSYIACPTIAHAYWKHPDRNHVGITDLKGLNLIPFLLTAHFNEELRESIEREAIQTNYPVVALYDSQAILVKDSSIRVIGEGKREFYNGFHES